MLNVLFELKQKSQYDKKEQDFKQYIKLLLANLSNLVYMQ